MTRADIDKLLEKYFQGDTSLEEENELKQYFSEHKIDPDLAHLKPLFVFFKNEKLVKMPEQQAVNLRPIAGGKKTGWRRFYSLAVAAAMLAAFAVGGFLYQKNMAEERARIAYEKLHKDSFEDPEKAMAEIQKALALVSRKMNKGKKEAAKGLQKVEKLEIFKNK